MMVTNRNLKSAFAHALLMSTLALSGLSAREVTCFVTAKFGERMARLPAAGFDRSVVGKTLDFVILEGKPRQTIAGFDASFLEAGMICLNSLEPEASEEVSPRHGNPDDNVQQPLVIINRKTKQVTYTGAYHYLAHFSKFVSPEALRLETVGGVRGARCVVFRKPEGGYEVESALKQGYRPGDGESSLMLCSCTPRLTAPITAE
jgi:hypothetical protein